MPGRKRNREWMPFFINDYLSDTMHLTLVEHGLYLRLLFYLWQHPEGLPKDRDMSRMFHVKTFVLDEAWKTVGPFFYERDGMIRHRRIDFELGISAKIREERTNAANLRWGKNDATGDANAILSDNDNDNDNTDPPISPKGDGSTALVPRERWRAEFDLFWSAYPKKKSKGQAEKAWQKLRPPIDEILQALSWQIRQPDWLKDSGQFVPYPATYLRAKGWEDSPPRNGPNLSGGSVGMMSAIERLTRKDDE